MNKKQKTGIPVVGAGSLMTIFAVLCLITFALLSISTVRANERLSMKSREMFTAYYEAESRAEEILAQLRVYHAAGAVPQNVMYQNGIYSYTCPISDTQLLEVAVTFHGEEYEILRWCVISNVSWEADDSLPVWDGL